MDRTVDEHRRAGLRVIRPVLRDRVRIEIRLGHHRQNLSGLRIEGNRCSVVIAHSRIHRVGQRRVEGCHDRIPLILPVLQFIGDFFDEKGMRAQKLEIRVQLRTGHPVCRKSDDVGVFISFRIHPRLIPLLIDFGSRQHSSVRRKDIPADDLLRQL